MVFPVLVVYLKFFFHSVGQSTSVFASRHIAGIVCAQLSPRVCRIVVFSLKLDSFPAILNFILFFIHSLPV